MLSLIKIRIRFLSNLTTENMFNKVKDSFVLEIKFNQGKITVMDTLVKYQNNYIDGVRLKEGKNIKQMIKKNNIRVPRRNDFRKQG